MVHHREYPLFYLGLDFGTKVKHNVAQYPIHHVCAPSKFEFAMSNGLGDAFTRKYIVRVWSWGQDHTQCCWVPSTSCYLHTCKVWSCYDLQFRRRSNYKKMHHLTLDLGVKIIGNAVQYPLHHMTYAPFKFEGGMLNRLGGDAITRKYNIWPWPWVQGRMKLCPVPSTSCDLCTSKGFILA